MTFEVFTKAVCDEGADQAKMKTGHFYFGLTVALKELFLPVK
jgi:hypothetical protein